jgi:5'-3' exonuclease
MKTMAIKGLWKYYQSKIGYEQVVLSEFSGTLIAVDAFSIMFESRSAAKTRYLYKFNPFLNEVDESAIDVIWFELFVNTIVRYMIAGVIPVLVFDSIGNDVLKTSTLETRSTYTDVYLSKLNSLLKSYKDFEPELVPNNIVTEANNLLGKINLMPSPSITKVKNLCKDIGIPYVFCLGEGERTCSLMNHFDIVSAIISPDSDSFCCGAKVVLKEKCDIKVGNANEKGFKVARLSSLLDNLEIDFNAFQDLCIMAGTDFNKNIKGVSLVRSLKLLKQHGSFEALSDVKDFSSINRDEVKKRFTIVPWMDTVREHSLEFRDTAPEAFEKYGINHLEALFDRVKVDCIQKRVNALTSQEEH